MLVTAVTAERRPRRSLLGAVISVLHARSRTRSGRPSRLAAALQEHVLTFAMLGAADIGGFRVLHNGGWFILAVSLFLADFQIRG